MKLENITVEKIRGGLNQFLEIAIGKENDNWYAQTADIYDETNLSSSLVEMTNYRTALQVAKNVGKLTGLDVHHWDEPRYKVTGMFVAIGDVKKYPMAEKMLFSLAESHQINVDILTSDVMSDMSYRISVLFEYDDDHIEGKKKIVEYIERCFADTMADILVKSVVAGERI